jgi:MoxR-like ATPase
MRDEQKWSQSVKNWWIYKGSGTAAERLVRLAENQPSWRTFDGVVDDGYVVPDLAEARYARDRERGAGYLVDDAYVDVVNTALLLRRPLLVTGEPGVGKSTLAFSIAENLGLGPVLRWPITSRSTLRDGQYRYDAIRRLEDANLRELKRKATETKATDPSKTKRGGRDGDHPAPPPPARPDAIGNYLQLGPLGTAFLPTSRPRVLLIDEIDKGDIDLPGDLLTVLEDGEFEIHELSRMAAHDPEVGVGTSDFDGRAVVSRGWIRCHAYPIVILASNGEREFPAPFLRRCIRLDIGRPDNTKLRRIVEQRIGPEAAAAAAAPDGLIDTFIKRRRSGDVATDQLLNAVQMRLAGAWTAPEDLELLAEATLHRLTGPDAG